MKPEHIDRLEALVDKKNWRLFDRIYTRTNTVLEALQKLCASMKSEEVDLVLDILQDYLILRDYSHHTADLIETISQQTEADGIVFSPIKDFEANRPKSGEAVLYEIHTLKRTVSKRITIVDTPRNTDSHKTELYHVAVDDFIGSGNQFLTMVNTLKAEGIDPKIDAVAALVVQETGRHKLEANGYKVFSCINRRKTIDDPAGVFGSDIPRAYRVYDELERRLSCAAKYRRGYAQTEASVSMKSTPNNTLPIFWYQGATKWPAPFPRP